jgi:hypothetical protein
MYINGKMRPVETIPGMGGGGVKENETKGVNSILIYCVRTFENVTLYLKCINNKSIIWLI